MDSNQNVAGLGVIDRIPRSTTQWNARHQRVGLGINDCIGIPMFIRDEYTLRARGICETIWVGDWPHLGKGLERLHVHNSDLVLARDRCIDAAKFGHRPDPMDAGKAIQICDDLTVIDVEHHKLVRIHVSDIEPPLRRVETLVIKTNGRTGQRNISHFLQG